MQKHHYKSSFLITLFLYMLLIGGYIYVNKYSHINTSVTPETKIIKLSLASFVPPPPPILPSEPEIPEPVEKPLIHKTIQTKPLPKPEVVKPKIKKKPLKRKKKKIQKSVAKPLSEVPFKEQSKTVTVPVPQKVPANNQAARKRFLSHIRTKIDQAKTYPRMAKKRRIQGIVQVSFTLTSKGNITNLVVTGPKVFHNSAKKAVMGAFPIDISNAPVSLPLDIRLKLHYQIH